MSEALHVPTMAEMMASGKQPEVLFWLAAPEVLTIVQRKSPKLL